MLISTYFVLHPIAAHLWLCRDETYVHNSIYNFAFAMHGVHLYVGPTVHIDLTVMMYAVWQT